MTRVSTGKLSTQHRATQERQYKKRSHYDFLVLGSGSAGLTVGSLLANAGHSVGMLEAHDTPGGYAHSFQWGNFKFCAQVHYIWGCGEGALISEYLKKIGLADEITFQPYNPEGYDHIILPDRRRVAIPNGFDTLCDRMGSSAPMERKKVEKFTGIVARIHEETRHLPAKHDFWKLRVLSSALRIPTIMRYRKRSLQDLFDECNLSRESQAILSGTAGDFMAPPRELSILAYSGLFGGYNTGAYYPAKHFHHYVQTIVNSMTRQEGCDIFLETPVVAIHIDKGRITGVTTEDGKIFTADIYLCNIDPKSAAKLIGEEHFSRRMREKLDYDYSHTALMMYLGLDIDLTEYGFGNHNTWHLEQWDMNQCWDELMSGDFRRPWVFMSTPTLHSAEQSIAPQGKHILEVATLGSYELFAEAKREGSYHELKKKVGSRLLDIVEEHHIPDLRRHIIKRAIGSPTTNEDFVLAPRGNAYGSHLTSANMGLDRLKSLSGIPNLFWCNASSGYGGVYGTVRTGVELYMNLTGDRFWKPQEMPSDRDLIKALRGQ